MKIGVSLFPSVGGSGHLATRLGEHMVQRGHEIHFITYRTPFGLTQERPLHLFVHLVDQGEYPLFEDVGTQYAVTLCSKLVEVANTSRLDVIHVHYAIPHAMSAHVAREITGVPYVLTLHGSDVHMLGANPAYMPVVKHTIREADRVTTVADFLRKMAIEKLGVEREIEVIPNFIDPKVFRRTSRVELVVEDGCPVMRERRDHTVSRKDRILLHVSNFRRVKRVVELIDAMRLVVDNVPEARLLLVGDGPTRTEVERRIEQHRLCNRVHLIGVRTNVNELMSSADLFVLNSNLEGMPLVLLEAMACELPVVTTPAGGVPELVRPGIDGIVTETFETEELAEGVIRLLTDDRLRARLGKAGRRRVLDGFTPEVIVPRYEKVLRSALNG